MVPPLLPPEAALALVGPDPLGSAIAEAAVAAGLVATVRGPFTALTEEAAAADCLLLALDSDPLVEAARAVAARCRPGTLIMDTAPRKEAALGTIDAFFPLDRDYLSVNPIHARHHCPGRSFAGEPVLFVPSMATRPEALERARAFWEALGARTFQVLPAEHDALLTLLYDLPRHLASALRGTLSDLSIGLPELARLGPGPLAPLLDLEGPPLGDVGALALAARALAERLDPPA